MKPHNEVIAEAIERTGRGIRWGHAEQENITDALKELLAQRAEVVPQSEYICKCGIRVTPHRCSTGTDF